MRRPATTTALWHIDCNAQQATAGPGGTAASNRCQGRLLVFTKTGGLRDASIKDAKIALQRLAADHNFAVDFTKTHRSLPVQTWHTTMPSSSCLPPVIYSTTASKQHLSDILSLAVDMWVFTRPAIPATTGPGTAGW